MIKYKLKQNVLVLKWTGKDEEIQNINESLKQFNTPEMEFEAKRATNYINILVLLTTTPEQSSSFATEINQYVVYDPTDINFKLFPLTEEELNQHYIPLHNFDDGMDNKKWVEKAKRTGTILLHNFDDKAN